MTRPFSDEEAGRIAAGAASLREQLRDEGALSDHPPHEQIEAYVDGTLDAVDREIVAAHLADCSICAEDVEDLRGIAPSAGARTRRPRWYAAAGLAVAAGLAGVLILTSDDRRAPETGAAPAPPSASATAAAGALVLKDGNRQVVVDAAGNLTGAPPLEPVDRMAIVDALRTGRLPIPEEVVALRGRTGTLMGGPAGADRFGPIRPVATAIADAPVFEWTPLPDAASYVVSVFSTDLDKVAESPPRSATPWTLDRRLAPGDYSWQVRARVGAGEVVAPRAPEPEARFRVLARADVDRLNVDRTRYAESPLTLGILLARAGMLDEARAQLEAVVAANPASPEARRLLDALRTPRAR